MLSRPSSSRHNSMRSNRMLSRDNGENGHSADGGVIHTIHEQASEYTSLLASPIKNGAEDNRPYVKWPSYFLLKTWQTLTSNYVNVLLVFVPLGIVSGVVVCKFRYLTINLDHTLDCTYNFSEFFSGLSPYSGREQTGASYPLSAHATWLIV